MASAAATRSRHAATEPPRLQTLDRVLQKELARGRLGFPAGHMPPPRTQFPTSVIASMHRERGKAALRDMTMIPSTLRAWEASHEKSRMGVGRAHVDQRVSRGLAGDNPAAQSATSTSGMAGAATGAAAFASDPTAASAAQQMSPYEMRRFLKDSQRYFLAVNSKTPFSVPGRTVDGRPANAKPKRKGSG